MHNIKRVFSLQANQIILSRRLENKKTGEGEDIYPRLRNDDRYAKLRWSETLKRLHHRFIKQHGTNHNFPPFKWQSSFRDHLIRDNDDYDHHIAYIRDNAMKHGLINTAEDWLCMWVDGILEPVFSETP
ncbi:MAG: hypothetical protein L0Y80_02380 [Ignavibacteriae bacterium]|nr:hypothetical protein [Ignavibacteriota bacterium]